MTYARRAGSLLRTVEFLTEMGLDPEIVTNSETISSNRLITSNLLLIKIPRATTLANSEYFTKQIILEIILMPSSPENDFSAVTERYELKIHCPGLIDTFSVDDKLKMNHQLKINPNNFITWSYDSRQSLRQNLKSHLYGILRLVNILGQLPTNFFKVAKVTICTLSSFCIQWASYEMQVEYIDSLWKFSMENDVDKTTFEKWAGESNLKSCSALEFTNKTVSYFDFYSQIHHMESFINGSHEKLFRIDFRMESSWRCLLALADIVGLYFDLIDDRIVVGDLVSISDAYSPIPFYLDSTRKPYPFGIITLLKGIPGAIISGTKSSFDFISVPTTATTLLVDEIHTVVDSHISLTLAEQLYQRMGALKVQSIPLTIMSDFGSKKLGFIVHLREGLKAGGIGHNNPGTTLSNLIFGKAHQLPVRQRYTFQWVQVLVELQNLEMSVLQDFVKLDGLENCTFELQSPFEFPHIRKSQPCLAVDSKSNIIHCMV